MCFRLLVAALLAIGSLPIEANDAKALYQTYCASCHGADRLGSIGPALLPDNLRRLRKDDATEVIANGRAATQMPGFAKELSGEQVQALAEFIYQAPAATPRWDVKDISSSHFVYHEEETLGASPVFDSDPMNLFVVVETGDHHATILDGDRFDPIHRFKTRFALHGGPKFSPDGRFVYFASRDGWISKFDLYNLETIAEIRAGINTRNLAVSSDGRYAMVANYLPHTLVLLDAGDLSLIKVFPVEDETGG
jgi:cytochrome c553